MYSQSEQYKVGDYCYKKGDTFVGLYKCIKDCQGIPTSNPEYWQPTTITDNLVDGGGSEVEVTPILTKGTKIAEILVDGETKELFAPSGGGGGGASSADEVSYDDSATQLGADNVQNAIEKLSSLGGGNIKYNQETDSLDVYVGEIIIGSIPCGFKNLIPLVPILTSTSPEIAQIITGRFTNTYRAFDQVITTFAQSSVSGSSWSTDYLGYAFGKKTTVKQIFIRTHTNANYVPRAFYLQGSDDGISWETIQQFTNPSGVSRENTFLVDSDKQRAFNSWRIFINSTYEGSGYSTYGCQIAELQFYGN